jgi:hypothetical protein
MAKLLLVCVRSDAPSPSPTFDFQMLANRLAPDNIVADQAVVRRSDNLTIAAFHSNQAVRIETAAVCVGGLLDPCGDWWRPLTPPPDGSFALFRSDPAVVELVSDVVASRTIWYYWDESLLLASTSQRALVFCLRSFAFNENVIPWMLSTGTLGPELSWDERIRALPGDSTLLLERDAWRCALHTNPIRFLPQRASPRQHQQSLAAAVKRTLSAVNLDLAHWVLPLSGGHDSRGILVMLANRPNLRCVTWGLAEALQTPLNDANVAARLAEHFDVEHRYFQTDISAEAVEHVFDRFLICGEGRCDQISGYMDGFGIWRTLRAEGICGIIRGDEGFGWSDVASELQVRSSIGLLTLSDFADWSELAQFDLVTPTLPSHLMRSPGESLASWRDRLYHQFRIPAVLAALNDLKSPFVEVFNPFLSRGIIYYVRTMPDRLRTNKKTFRQIVDDMGPDIPYARFAAIQAPGDVMRREDVLRIVADELRSDHLRSELDPRFLEHVIGRVAASPGPRTPQHAGFEARVKRMLPGFVRGRLQPIVRPARVDYGVLALRAYITKRMHRLLSEDALAGRRQADARSASPPVR